MHAGLFAFAFLYVKSSVRRLLEMKRLEAWLVLLLVLVLGSVGCGQAPAESSEGTSPFKDAQTSTRPRVVSTTFPGYDFARAVLGNDTSISMLLPPGAESHSFEPTPRDILLIQNCDVFVYGGGESDAWVDGILASMDTSSMTIIPMMHVVDVVPEELVEGMETDHEHEEGEEHGEEEHQEEQREYDEHVWTSPVNAIAIVRAIAEAICAIDADHADEYVANADAYVAKLEAIDTAFREVRSQAVRTTLIFSERFPFRYFVDAYDLDYFAAFPGCSTETEASAQTVAFLIDKTADENIPVVFYTEFSNEKMANTLCEATGAKKLLFHSCHNITRDELQQGVTYVELMTANVEALREALNQ